jgi:hypothetical protein
MRRMPMISVRVRRGTTIRTSRAANDRISSSRAGLLVAAHAASDSTSSALKGSGSG